MNTDAHEGLADRAPSPRWCSTHAGGVKGRGTRRRRDGDRAQPAAPGPHARGQADRPHPPRRRARPCGGDGQMARIADSRLADPGSPAHWAAGIWRPRAGPRPWRSRATAPHQGGHAKTSSANARRTGAQGSSVPDGARQVEPRVTGMGESDARGGQGDGEDGTTIERMGGRHLLLPTFDGAAPGAFMSTRTRRGNREWQPARKSPS
jgi:hypothetical protein